MSQYILALDQGTTSSRAIAFDRSGNIAALSQQSLPQHYPQAGWVEHDPLEIWDTQRRAAAEVIARLPEGSVAGIGVTNQRETTILWDKATGEPVYNAIVWQCRRTAELCEELKRRGLEERIRSATGLLIDAYFSGSKIRWILDNVPGVRRRAERGEVLFGTVESWLIWKLTGRHVTDYANASRTMLFDIHRLAWDEELCGILGVPTAMLPQPVPNSAVYGTVQPGIPGLESLASVPVCGAESVSLYCLEGYEEMPMGEEDRSECEREGIAIYAGWGPKEVQTENGKAANIAFVKCLSVKDESGRFAPVYDENTVQMAPCGTVLYCIGQKAEWKTLLAGTQVEFNPNGTAKADPVTYQTAEPDIFVGGDAYTGQKFAIDAIAAGKQGAISLHRYVQGATLTIGRDRRQFIELDKKNALIAVDSYDNTPRQRIGYNDALRKTFRDERVAFTAEQVKAETARCLGCGASIVDPNKCIGCGVCTTKCAFDAIHLHRERPECSTMYACEDKMKAILPYMIKRNIKIKKAERRAKKAAK